MRLILARRLSRSFSGASKIVKSRSVAGGSAPDAPLACVLSKNYWTLRLDLVLAATSCGASGATRIEGKGLTPGEAAVASPRGMEGVLPCADVSSRRLSAFSCSMSWICAAGSPADVSGMTPDESAVDSTPGGDAPSSCDASSGVSLL